MTKKEHIVVGLDIGTTKICAVVGEILADRSVNVIGIGSHRSTGLRKGMVVNMESTVESIKRAVEEAELMAAVQINSVYTGIAGSHIGSESAQGVVALKKREVTKSRYSACGGYGSWVCRASSRPTDIACPSARIHCG